MKINIKFYLRTDRENDQGEHPIRLKASFHNTDYWQDIELAVNPAMWSVETNRFREGNAKKFPESIHPLANIYNQILDSKISIVRGAALNLELQALTSGNTAFRLTREMITQALAPAQTPEPEPEPELLPEPDHSPTPQQIYDNWKAENAHLSPNTLRIYKQVVDPLNRFAETLKVAKITPQMINKIFVNQYFAWLRNGNSKIESDNSLGTHIKFLRVMLSAGNLDNSWLENVYSFEPEIITLTWPELQKTIEWEAPDQRWADFRDSALLMAFTGPRFMDFVKLNGSHIRQHQLDLGRESVLSYSQQKTDNKAFMLLNEIVLVILERNRGKWKGLVKTYSNQVMNRDLKTMFEMIGVDAPTSQITKVNRQLVQLPPEPKYNLITCHTLRKTAATMLIEGGADLLTVKDALGWKKIDTVMRYVKNSDHRHYTATAEAWAKLQQLNRAEPANPAPEQ